MKKIPFFRRFGRRVYRALFPVCRLFQCRVENYSDIIVAVTFFFTLFSDFSSPAKTTLYLDCRGNFKYRRLFSLFYRISGSVPKVQEKVRDSLRDHYQKILATNNWAYHLLNPSTTITRIFNAYSDTNDEEKEKLGQFSDAYSAFSDIQVSRKKMIMLYEEKLLPLQWTLIYMLALLMVVSFNFIPAHGVFIDVLKVFSESVFCWLSYS